MRRLTASVDYVRSGWGRHALRVSAFPSGDKDGHRQTGVPAVGQRCANMLTGAAAGTILGGPGQVIVTGAATVNLPGVTSEPSASKGGESSVKLLMYRVVG